MKYNHDMTPEPTLLDRLLEISELFQRDMAREFAGTWTVKLRHRELDHWEAVTPPKAR